MATKRERYKVDRGLKGWMMHKEETVNEVMKGHNGSTPPTIVVLITIVKWMVTTVSYETPFPHTTQSKRTLGTSCGAQDRS